MDMNEIMDMLDWNRDSDIQEEGRQLAENIKCLNVFMQPLDKQYNKNVWENCALILSKKSDDLLEPYVFDLLEWLQDMNWPGADIIYQRLLLVSMNYIDVPYRESFEKACKSKDTVWKDVLVMFWNEYQSKL